MGPRQLVICWLYLLVPSELLEYSLTGLVEKFTYCYGDRLTHLTAAQMQANWFGK